MCLDFLLKCLQITNSKMQRLKASMLTNMICKERRGNFTENRKSKSVDIAFVESYIRKIPSYESHYKISSTNSRYLSPDLNIRLLYDGYCTECKKENRAVLSEWMFRHIFNTKFNLSFHKLKIDTCHTCDQIEAKLKIESISSQSQEELLQERENHLAVVEKVKNDFEKCVEFARNPDNKTVVLTFDLERVLEVPSITTSEAFYRRKLSVRGRI